MRSLRAWLGRLLAKRRLRKVAVAMTAVTDGALAKLPAAEQERRLAAFERAVGEIVARHRQ